jgi:predicted nucleic acid-binding protein
MGSVTIPPGSLVYLDAVVVIYSVERVPEYWPKLRPIWEMSAHREIVMCSSELSLHEALVGPMRQRNAGLAAKFNEVMTASDIRPLVISREVLQLAAQLRAEQGLKTPDAIHAATALLAGCDRFLTNDSDFKRVPRLPLMLVRSLQP